MSVDLSIIIVNWNGEKFLPECIKSIVENPPSVSYEIILIDNLSSDGSIQYLKSPEFQQLINNTNFTLLESKENLGFGRANNLAMEKTKAKYIFMLNPDTIIKSNAIDKLIETLESDEKIGAVAPKLLNRDESLQPSVYGEPSPLTILIEGLHLYKILPKFILENWLFGRFWNYEKRDEVPIVAGAAILAKKEMLNEIGGFDPTFHMYGEDMEWCLRVTRSSWKIYFEPLAEIKHIGGQSSAQRWSDSEMGLIYEEAFHLYQEKCFPKHIYFFNILSRAFLCSLIILKRQILRKEVSGFNKILKLQLSKCYSLLFVSDSLPSNNENKI
jgi:hypothetical protein